MNALICVIIATIFVHGEANIRYPSSFVTQVQNYPNVQRNKARCLPQEGVNKMQNTLLCDPSGLLTVEEVNRLNTRLQSIKATLNSRYEALCDPARPRPVIGIALINNMMIGSSVESSDVMDYAAVFAYYIYDQWSLPGNCQNQSDKIIIFYSQEDGALYTYSGKLLKDTLPSKKLIKVAIASRPYFGRSIYSGLNYVLTSYENILSGNKVGLH